MAGKIKAITDNTSIKEILPLISARSAKCLLKVGVETVGEVRKLDDDLMLAMPNMGKRSVAEIRNIVGRSKEAIPKKSIIAEQKRLPPESIATLNSLAVGEFITSSPQMKRRVLMFIRGMSVVEVAKVEGISVGRMSQVKEKIVRSLGELLK